MESQAQVLETPDYHKTIDELNEELEQKHFSANPNIDTKPRELSTEDILHVFGSVRDRPIGKLGYLPDTSKTTSRNQRLKRIAQELSRMQQALANEPASELTLSIQELAEKAAALQQTAATQHQLSKHLDFAPTPSPAEAAAGLPGSLTYDVSLNAFKEQALLFELDQRVRTFEHVVGEWKLTRPISEVLGELLERMRFCNNSVIEKIESQSRHLSTDLDALLTAKARVGVSTELLSHIHAMHSDTHKWLSKLGELPLLLERLKAAASLHKKHLELDKRILRLERGSDQLMSTLTQLIQVSQQLSVNIGQGSVRLNSNIQALLNK